MAPGGYSQSCDFRRGFRDKWWSGRSLRDLYIGSMYTHIHMHICVQISYKRHFLRIRHMAPGSYSQSYSANSLVSGKIFTRITVDKYYRDTGVTVCACMRFACVIRSGYLVLANQHTSSEGQGSRDLRQTRVEPY